VSPIKRLIHDFRTPPEATKSISVIPAEVKIGRIQTPAQASQTFAIGLARQDSSSAAAAPINK
jgi:hypothetical protein